MKPKRKQYRKLTTARLRKDGQTSIRAKGQAVIDNARAVFQATTGTYFLLAALKRKDDSETLLDYLSDPYIVVVAGESNEFIDQRGVKVLFIPESLGLCVRPPDNQFQEAIRIKGIGVFCINASTEYDWMGFAEYVNHITGGAYVEKCANHNEPGKNRKGDLLKHYSGRDPKEFMQVDVHDVGIGSQDCVLVPDKNGLSCTYGRTFELMHGPEKGIRLLIDPGITAYKLNLALDLLKEEANSALRSIGTEMVDEDIPF